MADDRGQTTIDYAVGAGVFLITLAAVIAFVPGLFQPFVGGQEDTRVADRVASQLAMDLLGDPANPYVLDETCTTEFFDADGVVTGCRYSQDGASLAGALNVETNVELNVTIEDPAGIVTVDGVELRAGGNPPSRFQSVTVAQRAVLYGDETYRLYVRVW